MGMFDSVYFKCDCGEPIEEQSKSGECCLRKYSRESVPLSIAGDMIDEEVICTKCGAEYTIRCNQSKRVSLYLTSKKDKWSDDDGEEWD